MKEIRTLILVLFCVGILYWFIEPYAHSKLHPHVNPVNYDFAAGDIALAAHDVEAAKKALQSAEKGGDKIVNSDFCPHRIILSGISKNPTEFSEYPYCFKKT